MARPLTMEKINQAAPDSKLETLARAGYITKGVVYGTVGVLTLGALYDWFGQGSLTGTRGALEAIAAQPFGKVLLILMTIGLAGFTLWRVTQAIKDTEDKGSDLPGLVQRMALLVSGLAYASLALYAARMSGWFGLSGDGGAREEWTARLMSTEWGVWFVGGIGAALIVVGLYQCYRAFTKDFADKWRGQSVDSWAVRFSQFGIAARAYTFILIGWIVIEAAINSNAEQAKGLGHALRSLRDESYGFALLTLVGVGLVCYAVYCLLNARYRRIERRAGL